MPKDREDVLKFERDFMTGAIVYKHLGHLELRGRHAARLVLSPDGLILVVTQAAVDAGAVKILVESVETSIS